MSHNKFLKIITKTTRKHSQKKKSKQPSREEPGIDEENSLFEHPMSGTNGRHQVQNEEWFGRNSC